MKITELLPELTANKIRGLYKLLLDEVIGADEVATKPIPLAINIIENELKADQRAKLTALLGENEGI